MVWFKVDDSAHSHPKMLTISLAAVGLWTAAGSWSGNHLTDGFIPDAVLPTLCRGDEALASELLAVGLWTRSEGGFRFHEWNRDSDGTERNPTAEEVKRKRSARADAGRRGGIASGNARRSNKTGSKDEANASAGASRSVEPPTRPDPTQYEEEADASSSGTAAPRSKKGTKRGTRIPEHFPVDADMVEWARSECPLVDGKYETAQFCDYWASKTGANAVKLDWNRTWKTWMRKAQRDAEERRPSNVIAIRGNDRMTAKHDMIAESKRMARELDALEAGGSA